MMMIQGIIRIILLILSVAAYCLAANFTWVIYFAPLPLFLLVLSERAMLGFALAFLAYFFGNLAGLYSVYVGTGYPLLYALLPIGIEAAVFAAILSLVRLYSFRFRSWPAIFVFPACWVTYQFILMQFPGGDLTGVPVVFFLPLLQIVSITGLLGLSFLACLIPSGLAMCWFFLLANRRQAYYSLAATLLTLLFVVGFGLVVLGQPSSFPKIKVGLAAKNPTHLKDFREFQKKEPLAAARNIASAVPVLAAKGAKFILQPELSLLIAPDMEAQVVSILSQAASENQVYLFVAVGLIDRPVQNNALFAFDPHGTQIALYKKRHLVSGLEANFTPGNELVTLSIPEGLIGLAICHDMDFIQPVRDYSKLGTGILFVPAEDFGVKSDGKWHAEFAIAHSISGGFSLARSAYFGFLSLTDPRGRVIAWEPTQIEEETYAIGEVPVGGGRTVYAYLGNWFVWLNCLGVALILGRLAMKIASRK